jgi:hypothetical protein
VDLGRVGCHHAGVGIRLLAIGLIAGLLAACSGGGADPDPTPAPTPSTRPSSVAPSSTPATPSRTGPLTTGPNVRPGEKPPILDHLGMQRTDLGATVAGAYYFKALDWTIASNDDWLIEQLALPSCAACRRIHGGLASLQAKGTVERGGRIRVRSAVVDRSNREAGVDVAVRVVYDEDPVRLVASNGRVQTTQRAVRGVVALVLLRWVGMAWRVVEVTAP